MPQTPRLSPELFVSILDWCEAYLDYERLLLSGVPHHRLSYEDDLAHDDRHQATVDRVCGWLGIESAPVRATLRRTVESNEGPYAVNLDEIEAIAAERGYAIRPGNDKHGR